MNELLKSLLAEHKGKTVTVSISTIIAVMYLGSSVGVLSLPVPATQAYVDVKVTQATLGLPYLVKKEIERDVDIALFDVQCMRDSSKIGQLERLEREYEKLVGSRYERKDCQELETRLAHAGVVQ